MRFLTALFSVTAIVAPAFAAPATLLSIEKFNGKTSGKYIVKLKSGTTKASFLKTTNIGPSHEWSYVFNGFASKFSTTELDALRAHTDVESISEDGIASISTTQTDAPWGLARLTSTNKLVNQDIGALTYTYEYEPRAGAGIDIYVVGTLYTKAPPVSATFNPSQIPAPTQTTQVYAILGSETQSDGTLV
ncbi:hypothetical protein DXG01_001951 [Tephrocybe rancida]|nr:hypothetical protein DXG01_001951 [Tephrocybe rancida]